MTTITIKEGLKKNIQVNCDTIMEVAEFLLEEAGFVLLQPIESKEIRDRVKKHKTENAHRDLNSFDDI